MSTIIWGWAFAWLAWRLWLEWRVDGQWLAGSEDVREDAPGGPRPPPWGLTPEGERLWTLRWRVTVFGFLGWAGMVVAVAVATLAR